MTHQCRGETISDCSCWLPHRKPPPQNGLGDTVAKVIVEHYLRTFSPGSHGACKMLTCPQVLQVLGCFYEDLKLLGFHRGKMKKNRDKGEKRKGREGQSMVYMLTEIWGQVSLFFIWSAVFFCVEKMYRTMENRFSEKTEEKRWQCQWIVEYIDFDFWLMTQRRLRIRIV